MTDFLQKPLTKRSVAFRKPLLGVGVNDAPYITQPKINGKNTYCPYFSVWRSMITRCYSEKYQKTQPTYKDCSVCDEWLSFMSFRQWMEKQDWKGKHLDKDIIKYGNKVYSPDTCFFVSRKINNLLKDHRTKRGLYPIGVCLFEGKYMAQCSGRSKRYIGLFDSPEEASSAWAKEKIKVISSAASEESDPIKSSLLRIAKIITNSYTC